MDKLFSLLNQTPFGLKIAYKAHSLLFKLPAGTSRGILNERPGFFIFLGDDVQQGIGEVGPLKDLSYDYRPDLEDRLKAAILLFENRDFEALVKKLEFLPSIRFGFELALLDYLNGGKKIIFENSFSQGLTGIETNGLVWMGTPEFMRSQIEEKIKAGFTCVKLKVGALNFEEELKILAWIRTEFAQSDLEIRLDANGAFKPHECLNKLEKLAKFKIHSIEQPIKPGQFYEMATINSQTPIPIALDEELIGPHISDEERRSVLEIIKPAYLILKPTLLGGLDYAERWVKLAQEYRIGWWATSALESNIGLNGIAQWSANLKVKLPQGLGTGQLYTNNFDSPLEIIGSKLWLLNRKSWDFHIDS